MDLNHLLDQTRTYHRFTDKVVPAQAIERALELSLLAPNHKLTFPWKYFWVGAECKKQIYQIALEAQMAKQSEMTEEDHELLKQKMLNPELIFFAKQTNANPMTDLEDYATLSCSVQIFALALAEQGIGYKWNTGKVAFDPKVRTILGMSEQLQVVGLIQCGYPVTSAGPRKRPSLEQVLIKTN